ncbi:MAG: cobyrinate a,c-diamide synthase [Gammaproteobacteria bacterium]
MDRLFISAAHKSSGKTTVTLGLCAALRSNSMAIQPFKKGPDYIDPMWLTRAAGHDCINLDFNTMSEREIKGVFNHFTRDKDIAVIEGNKGLYDGLDLEGRNSNAAIAKLLETTVILVLDSRGMTRGVAPLILGYEAFDKDVSIGGVILNRVGGSRHESKLRSVIEHYTDIPVIGALPNQENLEINERHLGLIPSNEEIKADQFIEAIKQSVLKNVDLDSVLSIAKNQHQLRSDFLPESTYQLRLSTEQALRIGIIKDNAFGFYYPDDLKAFRHQGCELVFIDSINDVVVPDIDGLFIGGGFPETSGVELERNASFRTSLREKIEAGLPVYAECGGLMYLCRSIDWQNITYEMTGIIPGDVKLSAKPQGRGYIKLMPTTHHLWNIGHVDDVICGHEFHYSRVENLPDNLSYGYDIVRGTGIDGHHDGLIYKNLIACYSHQRHTAINPWTSHFIDFIQSCR